MTKLQPVCLKCMQETAQVQDFVLGHVETKMHLGDPSRPMTTRITDLERGVICHQCLDAGARRDAIFAGIGSLIALLLVGTLLLILWTPPIPSFISWIVIALSPFLGIGASLGFWNERRQAKYVDKLARELRTRGEKQYKREKRLLDQLGKTGTGTSLMTRAEIKVVFPDRPEPSPPSAPGISPFREDRSYEVRPASEHEEMGMSPKKKLMQIAVFWRNDEPDGLGLEVADERFLSVVAPVIDRYLHEGSADITSDMMLDQLVALGRKKASGLTFEEQIVAILNIAALEHRGVIPTNQFNGISYVFAER